MALLVAACGSTPSDADHKAAKPAAEKPRAKKPAAEDVKKLAAFEKLYRKLGAEPNADEEAQLEAQRIELCMRPDTAFWLARLFVHDAVVALDAGAGGDVDFLRIATQPGTSPLDRAVGQLKSMGPHAVACVREDLLHHSQADRRQLGVRILSAIGPVAAKEVAGDLANPQPSIRRSAVEALATMAGDVAAREGIEHAARDEHFAVRGAAWSALAASGIADATRLVQALEADSDPYVQRTIAKELGRFSDPAVVGALRSYRARCIERGDSRGIEAADQSLRVLVGRVQR
jgi:hypothetical protein